MYKGRIPTLIMIVLVGGSALFPSVISGAEVEVEWDDKIPTVKVVEEDELLFEHAFPNPHHIYDAEISMNEHYLMIRHKDFSPIQLKVFRLTDGKKIADFVPGVGGKVQWTYGDKILHAWGSGTNNQMVRVYDITGAVLEEDGWSAAQLTDRGYYIIYPSMALMPGIGLFDVNTGETHWLVKDARGEGERNETNRHLLPEIKVGKDSIMVEGYYEDGSDLEINLPSYPPGVNGDEVVESRD